MTALDRSRARLVALSPNLRGMGFMLLSTLSFATMILCARAASETYPAAEIAFFRAVFGMLFLVPVLLQSRFAVVRTRRLGLHVFRNVIHAFAVISWFLAIAAMNLSDAMALQFTTPLFTMLLAALILKETVDPGRWGAALVAFLGVLVILRPGLAVVSAPALIVLGSSALYGYTNFLTKVMSRTESGYTVVFYMNLVHMPVALSFAAFSWITPSWADLPVLAGTGIAAWMAHVFMTKSFSLADANTVMPIDFVKLPFITLMAYTFFDQLPTVWSWAGGIVIFAATYYVVRRGARAAAPARRAPA